MPPVAARGSGDGPVKVLLSWSSGKDCAWALHVLRQTDGIEVVGLVTTVNQAFDRVAMHAVRRQLVEAQAEAAGLPLEVIALPWPCPNEDYERLMAAFVGRAAAAGVEAMAFGDLFLDDIRAYRERMLAPTPLRPLFPLWGRDTAALARDMVDAGVAAWLTCVDPNRLDRGFAGRQYDLRLLAELPPDVDPCGEKGEFHTFVAAGPMFTRAIEAVPGEVVERDGFVFADLVPGQG